MFYTHPPILHLIEKYITALLWNVSMGCSCIRIHNYVFTLKFCKMFYCRVLLTNSTLKNNFCPRIWCKHAVQSESQLSWTCEMAMITHTTTYPRSLANTSTSTLRYLKHSNQNITVVNSKAFLMYLQIKIFILQ